MSKVQTEKRKTFTFHVSGRSSDFITPSFGFGCLFNCTYCTCKRHIPDGLKIATNPMDIMTELNSHVLFCDIEKPNQTDPEYVTYDISCNEDFALHYKYHPWQKIFEFFRDHPRAKATLATKTIPVEFLKFNPQRKVRIRFSLMPQRISSILEPNTAKIQSRLNAINDFIDAGYEVHVNFSPVVVYEGWGNDYRELFKLLDQAVRPEYKEQVLAEVIFLTHNRRKHEYNIENQLPGEDLIWTPHLQETKISQVSQQKNLRYQRGIKKDFVNAFIEVHDEVIPWNRIRYIF